MKKLLSIFIGLTILLSTITYGGAGVWAEEPENEVIKTCKEQMDELKKAIGREKEDEFDKESIELEEPYDLSFRIKFEEARTLYHDFVKCIFDNATAQILGSAAGETEGIFSANSPNLAEWMKPEAACLEEPDLKKILEQAGPEGLLKTLLKTNNQYVDYLRKLRNEASTETQVDDSTRKQFQLIVDRANFFHQLVENEAKDSIVALDSAFIALKELRQAFVIHVRFQCMLKHLELYRRVLENLRSVMWVIPDLIKDASKH